MSILALASDTLVGTAGAGNIEYNGQFFGTDSNASRAQMQRITQGTSVASTSGTSIDFTGLPAWVKRITVILSGVSTSGTSNLVCRIGDGSISSSGYASGATRIGTSGAVATSTAGYLLTGDNGSASIHHGSVLITNISSNSWTTFGVLSRSDDGFSNISGGSKTLSATLDRVRITTVNGTDTFDAGSINILYEG